MPTPEPNQAELAVLHRLYSRAAGDLAGLLKGTAFQQGKATILLRQIDAISRRLGAASDAWVTAAMRGQYLASARAVDRDLAGMGFPLGEAAGRAGADFLRVNQGAVGQFARQLARDLAGANKSLSDQGRRIISRTSQKILADPELSEQIARGLVSGGSVNKIARGLRTRLTEAGRELLDGGKMTAAELEELADFSGGYIQAGKARLELGYYCRMVASYQLREAVVEATAQRLQEQGEEFGDPGLFDLVVVTGPVSGDYCDFYVGKVFSLSGRSGEYPPLASIPNEGPPFHPNCTHTIAPFIDRFASAQEKERGKTSEKLLGLDPRQAQARYNSPDRALAARRGSATTRRDDLFRPPEDWGPGKD